jgi:hypothetical protein
MTNEEYLSAWKNIIWRETSDVPGRYTTHSHFRSVVIPDDVVWNIYDQLVALKGHEVVYFIPGDDDADLLGHIAGKSSGQNHYDQSKIRMPTSQIVGSLVDVAKKSDACEMTEHIWVKVQIKDDLKHLPFRGYALHLGLKSDKNEWVNPSPILTKEGWPMSVLKSCVVKGLYWKALDTHNHWFGRYHMFSYYNQRSMDLYIYEPGRCYW